MAQLGTQLESFGTVAAAKPARPWARGMRRLDDSRFFPLVLLIPILIFFVVWNIIPLLWLLGVSFYRFKLTSSRAETYVGFETFRTSSTAASPGASSAGR